MNSVVWMEVYKWHPRRWCRRLVGRIVHAKAGERLVSLLVHPRRWDRASCVFSPRFQKRGWAVRFDCVVAARFTVGR